MLRRGMRSPPPDSSCRWMIAANSKLFALRILYHVREAAWYNCPSKGGCRVSGEPLGITRYNNRSAVIVPYSFSNYPRTTAAGLFGENAPAPGARPYKTACQLSASIVTVPRSLLAAAPSIYGVTYALSETNSPGSAALT